MSLSSQRVATMQQKRFMPIIDLICVICLARLGFTATVPLAQSIDSSPVDPLSANITSVAANIDSRFHIESYVEDILVNENDCLMNVIITMGYLSAGEFTRPIEPTIYRDSRYPSVSILIFGPDVGGGGPIEARFLLWGLYSGLRPMLQLNDWRLPEFILFWEGEKVGSISVATFGPQLSLQGSNSTNFLTQRPTKSSNSKDTSSHINTTQPASPNPTIAIKVEPTSFGAALPKINIFMVVLECLLYLARKSSDEVLLAFSVTPFPPYNVVLRLQPIFRTQEPFFDYGVAGIGLPTVPSKLISERHQQWTEVSFDYVVGSVLIGKGEIARA